MTHTIFDSSTVEPARQFDLFHETLNQQIVRITPQRPEGPQRFPARILSYGGKARSCHIIEAPSHAASRTAREIARSDPDQVHLSYMMAGDRRLRARDCDTRIGAGHLFAVDTRKPFDLLRSSGSYRAVKLVFPAGDMPPSSSGAGPFCPEFLRSHRLYGVLCAACASLGSELEQADDVERNMLMSVAECLFSLIARQQRPETADDWRREMFAVIGLEMDRHIGDAGFDLDRLARGIGLSHRYVQRVMERHGTTFSALLREKRMEYARNRLTSSRCKIDEIVAESGYSELSAFYRAFKRQFGYAPGAVRQPDTVASAAP
ncbi:MAG: helix-turn-helix domain-containing protein [Alphaproteobacteria bacterium]